MKIAVIGLGRWGPNHVRNFQGIKDCRVVAVADPVASARERIVAAYPDIAVYPDYRELWARNDLDAVVVATPTSTHFTVVKEALERGLHVLCEKPLVSVSREGWELVELARRQNRVLMVGHVFLFNPGIQNLFESLKAGLLGPVYYINAVRTNLGPFRQDVNAAWDLASHDIYIFNHLLGQRPIWVSAVGAKFLRPAVEDIVFLTLQYPGGVLGHVHVSWLDPKKVRQITVVGEKKMITWDEFGAPGPIMIYDRSVAREPRYDTFGEFQLLAREGDVVMPRIAPQEPLAVQARAFAARCRGETLADERGSAAQGAQVVDILESASRSLAEDGRRIEVAYGG